MRKENFKNTAKRHQLNYFGESKNQSLITTRKGRAQTHWLNDFYAAKGEVFYKDYGVFEAVREKRGGRENTPEWFYDTLRSQHIPFNLFIPLLSEKELAKQTLNELLKLKIENIDKIHIEFPSIYSNPLKDKTSFDAFISYEKIDKSRGMIGIEVKYTEGGYSPTETEKLLVNDSSSDYYDFTRKSGDYKDEFIINLKGNFYRQIWRNHLLAFAFAHEKYYSEYSSVTFYHEGNTHFENAFKNYANFLTEKGKTSLQSVTFSQYCSCLLRNANTKQQQDWINYLIQRYDVTQIKETK